MRSKRHQDKGRYVFTTFVDDQFCDRSEITGMPSEIKFYSWMIGKTIRMVIDRRG